MEGGGLGCRRGGVARARASVWGAAPGLASQARGVLGAEAQAPALLPGSISSHLPPRVPAPPTFRGLQTHPGHPAPDFNLCAQQALFAGLHRYANLGAAYTLAWEARRGHAGVKGCACPSWAWGTAGWTAPYPGRRWAREAGPRLATAAFGG